MFRAEIKMLFARDISCLLAAKKRIVPTFIAAVLLEAIIAAVLIRYGFQTFVLEAYLPAAVWVVLLISAAVSLDSSYRVEKRNQQFMGVLINPPDAAAVYFAKIVSNGCMLVIFAMALLAVHLTIWENMKNIASAILILVGLIVVFGLSTVGSLVAAHSLWWPARRVLYPLALAAATAPLIVAATLLTRQSVLLGHVNIAVPSFAAVSGYAVLSLIVGWATFDEKLMRKKGRSARRYPQPAVPPGKPASPAERGMRPHQPPRAGGDRKQ